MRMMLTSVVVVIFLSVLLIHVFTKEGWQTSIPEPFGNQNEILVLTYENEPIKKTNTKYLSFLLTYFNFPDFKICGQGDPWTGWSGRMKGYIAELRTIKDKHSFVVVCDGRDVLVNNSYETFKSNALNMYREADNRIIFGAERYCIFEYCDDVHKFQMRKYKTKQCPDYDTEDYYLNFGLLFGQVGQLLTLFETFDILDESFDDQREAAMVNQRDQQFYMDYKQIIFGNTFNTDGDCTLAVLFDEEDAILEYTKYKTKPAFMHFPGKDACYYDALALMINQIKPQRNQKQELLFH